jgi:DNA-binding transcriptional regulator YdaS (Cro superfamily)
MKKADAIKHFGSATLLARALDISSASVSMWGDDVPAGRAFQLQVLTKGQLRAVSDEPKIKAAAAA